MPIFKPKRRKSPPRKPEPRSRAERRPDNSPPVGDVFVASVRDLASDGRGILSHPDGLTVFVAGVWPGESGRFRFTGLQNRVGKAEVVEITEPSPSRGRALCPHHGFAPGDCGGCPWQFMDYGAQLKAKQRRVEAAFADLSAPVQPIWPSPREYGYRNRAQLKTDGERIGYVSAGSHQLAAISECPILTTPNQRTLQHLCEGLPKEEWRPKGRQSWTTLNIDESVTADTVQVNSRLPFQQANEVQNQKMQSWLAERCAALDKSGTVLELFCGSGNFTRILAEADFQRIVAVDGSGPAAEALEREQLPRVTVLSCDLFQADNFRRIHKIAGPFSTLVLDPPRDGMRNVEALLTGAAGPPIDIFYISCNLPTLERDAKALCSLGYEICEVQALDQAPHTPHIELLCHLRLQ